MKLIEQNKINIAVNATNIQNIKDDIKEIKIEVTNHIPTLIKGNYIIAQQNAKDLDKRIDKIDVKIGQLTIKISVIVAIISFGIQYFIK